MQFRSPSGSELEGLRAAVSEFKAHWKSFSTLWHCTFEGTVEDIRALDYLDYEGIGYPGSGVAGAALVWGNVLEKSGPFRWLIDDCLGSLVLVPASGFSEIVIWPFGRVYEIQNGYTQFGKYRWLLEEVVVHCLGNSMEEDDVAMLVELINSGVESGFVGLMEAGLGELRGRRS